MVVLRLCRSVLSRLIPIPPDWTKLITGVWERFVFFCYRAALLGLIGVQLVETTWLRIAASTSLVVALIVFGGILAEVLRVRLTYDIFAWLQQRRID
jgi:hypothetical protein